LAWAALFSRVAEAELWVLVVILPRAAFKCRVALTVFVCEVVISWEIVIRLCRAAHLS